MNRREAIKRGCVGLWACVLARPGLAVEDSARRRLPIPRLQQARGEDPIELVMKAGRSEIIPGVATDTWGFNGAHLGPTVRVRRGQDVSLTYRNGLDEPVAVHGHGLHVAGNVDGGPQQLIEPGDSWAPTLPIRQRAATSWYHPHTHGRTGYQVYHGLAGLLIIDDDVSDELPLPKTYGVDDIPVIVQDRTIDRGGRLVYEPSDDDDGFLADTITVNGISDALATVPAGLVRLRVLNGSNARFYRFRFADDRIFHKIATDGGFLEEPVPIRDMVMVPGERNEVLVDFSDGRPARLVSSTREFKGESRWRWDDRRHRNDWDDWGPGGLSDAFEILTIDVDPELEPEALHVPKRLDAIERPTREPDWPVRRFELSMDMDDDDRRGAHGFMTINDRPMDFAIINERVRRGQWERWKIESDDGSHPFHIHGCSFLVVSQDGRTVPADNAGWKDTVWVDDRTELLVKFEHEATPEFPYMYHCHILEHEDRGMMGQFTVT